METPFDLDPEQQELKQKIFPYLKALSYELVQKQPERISEFMIDFLTKQGNYTASGLTKKEKKELEVLRLTVKYYRDLEKHNLASSQKEFDIKINTPEISDSSFSEENDDVMDEKEEELITKKLNNIKQSQDTKSRTSVSAEVYGLFNKKENFVPKVIPKNEDQMNRIKGKIISSFIFSSLEKKDLDVVINAMEEKRFKLNEKVITQGEDGDCLYIVETGNLKCYKTFNPEDSPKFLKTYQPGESFGELALLYNCPRAATIICSTDECILWSLDRETFNHIVKDAAQKKREKYENFLKNVDILSTIDDYELGQICDSLKDGIYKKDEYIIREGELGDVFYILEEGKCNATKTLEPGKPETVIKELKEGDYFGERALLKGEPRYANIVVTSDIAKVISLDRLSFNRLLGPIMDILKRNVDKYQVYCINKNEDKENEENNENKENSENSENNENMSNNNDNNNMKDLNNILTSDNNEKINIPNIINDNNSIDKEDNIIINKEEEKNIDNNYTNIQPNLNLNSIITSDVKEDINNNTNEIINENIKIEKIDEINNNEEENKIPIINENNNQNENGENQENRNNNITNLTSIQDVLVSNNNSDNLEKKENNINSNKENNDEINEKNDINFQNNENENKINEEKEEELNYLKNILEYKNNENNEED